MRGRSGKKLNVFKPFHFEYDFLWMDTWGDFNKLNFGTHSEVSLRKNSSTLRMRR